MIRPIPISGIEMIAIEPDRYTVFAQRIPNQVCDLGLRFDVIKIGCEEIDLDLVAPLTMAAEPDSVVSLLIYQTTLANCLHHGIADQLRV